MAVNKRKVLEAARKQAQKGAKQKALKEYNQLLKLDPRDAKLRLEIGDAHRRWGEVEEAVGHYTKVADQYQQDGFDARAVAVYKQILNLDPKRYGAYVSLSELYQRMGLDAEAIASLQTAADGFHKEGKKREALELLRKMAAIDPSNTTSRTKVAELLKQEGLEDDAVAEYEAVASELIRQGATDQVESIYLRVLELRPRRADILLKLARNAVELRIPERAESYAKRAVELMPDDSEPLELLCDVYKALERTDGLIDATKKLAKLYRARGDEDQARTIMQRLPVADSFDATSEPTAPGFDATEEEPAADDDLLGEDAFLEDGTDVFELDDEALGEDELQLEMPADVEDPGLLDEELSVEELLADGAKVPDEDEDEDTDTDAEVPDGDPDQLIAEASVYLRYGKRDQALANLEAVIAREPDHRSGLEKLGEAYAEAGDNTRAVELWSRAAERAHEEGEPASVDVLCGRVAALDPATAVELSNRFGAAAQAQADEAPEVSADADADAYDDSIDIDLDDDLSDAFDEIDEDTDSEPTSAADAEIDIDVDLDEFAEEIGAQEDEADESEAHADESADLGEPEFATDDDAEESDEQDAGDDVEDAEEEEDDDEIDIDIDLDDDELAVEENAGAQASETFAAGGSSQSATSSQQISEELEEAEFYFEQGLYEEAGAIYQRVLELAPNHPSALLRLGEIAAARGDDPSAAGEAPRTDEADGDSSETFSDAAEDLSEPTLDAAPAAAEDEFEGLDDEQPEDEQPDDAAGEGVADDEPEEATASALRVDDTVPIEEPAVAAQGEDDDRAEDGGFDLAAELGLETGPGASGSRDGEEAFASIFSDFKKGVSETLGEGDFETRYDLAIAYKEMGLLDDAIEQFQVCLGSESRSLDSLQMMAACALDLGRAGDAVGHLEQALAREDLASERRAGLSFDLGRAFAAAGDVARARSAFEAAREQDPGYPGIDEQLAEIDAMSAATDDAASDAEQDAAADEPQETFESFDDLIAEAEAESAAADAAASSTATDETDPAEESFEGFDDVLAEAEEALDASDPVDDGEAAASDVEASEPDEQPSEGPKRKRKKISFV